MTKRTKGLVSLLFVTALTLSSCKGNADNTTTGFNIPEESSGTTSSVTSGPATEATMLTYMQSKCYTITDTEFYTLPDTKFDQETGKSIDCEQRLLVCYTEPALPFPLYCYERDRELGVYNDNVNYVEKFIKYTATSDALNQFPEDALFLIDNKGIIYDIFTKEQMLLSDVGAYEQLYTALADNYSFDVACNYHTGVSDTIYDNVKALSTDGKWAYYPYDKQITSRADNIKDLVTEFPDTYRVYTLRNVGPNYDTNLGPVYVGIDNAPYFLCLGSDAPDTELLYTSIDGCYLSFAPAEWSPWGEKYLTTYAMVNNIRALFEDYEACIEKAQTDTTGV